MTQPKFFIGVWAQPPESFPKWKAEGVNLIASPERNSGKTAAQVRKACADNGLYYLDQASDVADLEVLIADPWCLRIMLPDEPDLYVPSYNVDPAGFNAAATAFISKWKPFYDQCKGRKKFWVNFPGPHVTMAPGVYQGQNQKPFGSIADEVAGDWYPINNDPARYWDQYNTANPDILPVLMIKCLKNFFPGKPVWSFIEVCDQNLHQSLNDRGPTGPELTKQANDMIAQGISGLIYFAHRIGGGYPWDPAGAPGMTAWDGRTAEQVAACKAIALKMNPPAPPVDKYQVQIDAMKATLHQVSALLAKI